MPTRAVNVTRPRSGGGVVTRARLSAFAQPSEVDNAVKAERLFVGCKGVYAVGGERPTDRGRIRAATLATGPHSAASFSTATALRNLIPTLPAVLHVSLTHGQRRSRADLKVHRGLEPDDVTHIAGIPVTTTLRTLEDLNWPQKRSCSRAAGACCASPTAG